MISLIDINQFTKRFSSVFLLEEDLLPWEITKKISSILEKKISQLSNNYKITNGIAIHNTAIIEQGVILKAPIIISANCFVGANVY